VPVEEGAMSHSIVDDAQQLTHMLAGKVLRSIECRDTALSIEFVDGTRLSVDCGRTKMKLSVTDGPQPRWPL
jgi:hypothetical protein